MCQHEALGFGLLCLVSEPTRFLQASSKDSANSKTVTNRRHPCCRLIHMQTLMVFLQTTFGSRQLPM